MKFSKRIEAMQSSPVRKLVPYAQAAKAQGKKVYHLNIGQPDVKTPAVFFDAVRKLNIRAEDQTFPMMYAKAKYLSCLEGNTSY